MSNNLQDRATLSPTTMNKIQQHKQYLIRSYVDIVYNMTSQTQIIKQRSLEPYLIDKYQ